MSAFPQHIVIGRNQPVCSAPPGPQLFNDHGLCRFDRDLAYRSGQANSEMYPVARRDYRAVVREACKSLE